MRAWDRYEGPTWCVAIAVYAFWFALVGFHAKMPWWAMVPLGAWLIAWHGSLQHETIHSFVSAPRPLRVAVALIPLGVLFPYASYRREHRRHHRANRLTDPRTDPESFYHDPERWRRYSPIVRVILRSNQTLLGRLTIGAAIAASGAVLSDAARVKGGDRRPLRDWAIHGVLVGVVFAWVSVAMGMPWWQYLALVAYPGASLTMLRSFYEHSWSADTTQRTTVVENRFPFGLLFLNNNYHVVHHDSPSLPWYRIPAAWSAQREMFLAQNGGRHFTGYDELARRWLLRPAFHPESPGE